MNPLASVIRDRFDILLGEYDGRLQTHPAYAAMTAASRQAVVRRTWNLVVDWLQTGEDAPLVQYIQSRVKELAEQGRDVGIMQHAINELEAVIGPMVTDVETAKLVWRTLSKVRDLLAQLTIERQRASEHNLQQMVDQSPLGIYHVTLDGRVLDANPTFVKITGYDSTEAINRVGMPSLYQNPADRQRLLALLQQGPVTDFETNLCRADGRPITIAINARLVQEAGSQPVIEGILEDITERKRAEAALRESEERFRHFSEATREGVVFHEKGKITDVNAALIAMFGLSDASEAVGKGLLEFIAPDSRESVVRQMQAGSTEPYEAVALRKDGTTFPVEASARSYEYQGQTFRVASLHDITARKQLERRIQESLERRGRQVQTSTEVAQEIAAAPALDELFRRVVTLIKEQFGYYHAQIFRYDPAQGAVVLVTGYGEAGRKMLAAGHKLAMGRGVVGTAAATGKSILATDTAQDKDWRPNPNLPDTKGELAVPIKLRDEVLGILDVQSDRVGALTAEDQVLLEGLCGQIAIAIENTRAKEALNREQYLMRVLMDNTPDHIYFKDLQSRFIQISKSQADRFGLSDPALAAGKTDFDFFTEDHARPAYEDEQEIIRTGQPLTKEEKETWPGRPDTWVWTNKLPLRDEAGNIIGTFGISRDITERRQAEEALRQSQAQLSEALRTARLANWEYDVASDTFTFNDQFYNLLHTTAEREGGYTMSSAQYAQRFVHPEDAPLVGEEVVKAIQATDPNFSRELDHRFFYADGGMGYITVRFRIQKDAQGRTVRTFGANQDITETKLAEEKTQQALRELERLYRTTTREGWQAYQAASRSVTGYLFDRMNVKPQDIWLPQVEQAIQQNTLVTAAQADGGERVAVAPLSVRGEAIGAVGIYDDPQHPLSPEDLSLVQEITEQGALALENARLFEQTQAALTETQTLNEISGRFNTAASFEEVLQAAASPGIAAGASSAGIWLFELDESGKPEWMEFAATWVREGAPVMPLGTRLRLVDFPSYQVWLNDTGRPTFISNIPADERVDPRLRATFEQTRIQAAAFMPLTVSGRWVGVVIISWQSPHPFTASEQQLYQSIAAQATVAIENRRLLDQTRTALAELETTQRTYLREQWGTYLGEAAQRTAGFVESPAGPAAVSDIWLPEMEQALATDAPVTTSGAVGGSSAQRAALALPIKLRGEPIGVLEFYNEGGAREWSDDERALVSALADQAALALENVRLFEDTQARAQREQMINAITARIRASTDMEAILKTAAEELSKALNLSRARIRLTPGEGRSDNEEATR